jgi:hypothetical protein
MATCTGKTKTGTPCRAPAGPDGLCYFHAHPEQAQVLGQVGGRKNRSRVLESADIPLEDAGAMRDLLSKAIHDVIAGEISTRTAASISQLSNSLRPYLQSADLEARVTRLEQQLAEREKTLDQGRSFGGHNDGERSSSGPSSDDKTLSDDRADSEDGDEGR